MTETLTVIACFVIGFCVAYTIDTASIENKQIRQTKSLSLPIRGVTKNDHPRQHRPHHGRQRRNRGRAMKKLWRKLWTRNRLSQLRAIQSRLERIAVEDGAYDGSIRLAARWTRTAIERRAGGRSVTIGGAS